MFGANRRFIAQVKAAPSSDTDGLRESANWSKSAVVFVPSDNLIMLLKAELEMLYSCSCFIIIYGL